MKDGDSGKQKSEIAKKEEEILKFWQDNQIFEKTLVKEAPKGEFVFYDGPPFATGVPHYGHILASAIKDAIPRYKTMQGYYVRRRWGWDCHGLPIENIAEKDLKISGKKQIEEIGIKKFNEHARSKVLEYIGEWKRTVERIGRWVDFDGSYKTMDNSYMESVWWAIKKTHEQNLLYEGTRVLPYCPRCETPIANSEIAMDNSYKDIKDISVYVKFKAMAEPKTYFLAWTTTPWTLPGNTALAINPNIDYAKIKIGEEFYILAVSRLSVITQAYEQVGTLKGSALVGQKYEPLFNYYSNDLNLKNKENGWQIYEADFVTTEDGTGIVHIAPAFGEDDMNLAKLKNLPIVWHVDGTGRFKPEVKDFAGLMVKPKDDLAGSPAGHLVTDIKVIQYLEDKKLILAKENIMHSYPHCHRCETPLYYYAIPAWFIDIQKIKKDLLNLNLQKINWVPEHLKTGRFNNIVEGAPDWNISRNRYWATPLPIWNCASCHNYKVAGSVDELVALKKSSGNKYYFLRHGEAEANAADRISAKFDEPNHLTGQGQAEVLASIKKLEGVKIDYIFASDFLRCRETVELAAKENGFALSEVIYDKRLREIDPGNFTGQTWREYNDAFGSIANRLHGHLATGGENYNDIRRRTLEFLYEIDQKYSGKNILIVSHGLPLFMISATINRLSDWEIEQKPKRGNDFNTGELRELPFVPLPHNDNFELDLHRPYIDDFEFDCPCGGRVKRINEVVDCWLESGSMPFASNHYPFADSEVFDPAEHRGFPAQFIAEYIAQTRTWFYYMLVMSKIILDDVPFENVVTTGTILAEDGEKMSKSKGNFPDPWLVFDRYGVDALRWYLLTSPVMRAEDINFSEKSVAEIYRKIIVRLLNVAAFYQMYTSGQEAGLKFEPDQISNVLDIWILSRLKETLSAVEKAFDQYEIDRVARPLDSFIDDLSTWYLRRSRERFKSEDQVDRQAAMVTTKFVLRTLAKIVAPLAPFVAEELYRELPEANDKLSVHLEAWPQIEDQKVFNDDKVIETMAKTRAIISLGLEKRALAGIKVRQPLTEITVKDNSLAGQEEFLALIRDELNVKKVSFQIDLGEEVSLDTQITTELQEEGTLRELMRQIQEQRKQMSLLPGDLIDQEIETDAQGQELLKKFETEFTKATKTRQLNFKTNDGEAIKANDQNFKIKITRF